MVMAESPPDAVARPVVSVAIRASRERYLREAIESVLTQSFAELELVIYDDAGDLGPAVASHQDGRVRYQRPEQKLGDAGRTREALRLCRGEYIGLLDDDDHYEPGFLERVMTEFERDESLGLVFTNHYWLMDGRRQERQCAVPAGKHEYLLPELLRRMPVPLSSTLMRRAVFEQGERDAPLPDQGVWGDLFLWLRAADAGWPFLYVDEPLMTYRVHGSQISRTVEYTVENGVATWMAFRFDDPECERLRQIRLAESLIVRAGYHLADRRLRAARADLVEARRLNPEAFGAKARVLHLLASIPGIGPAAARLWRTRPRRVMLGPSVVP